jgi:tetratricopeptide (TPR) repeat protein
VLSPAEIAERLDVALAVLGRGPRDAPVRQQTLRATIDWSHGLLGNDEQQCFARFAVFAGGATVEAAETVTAAGLDVLDGLVAKSLLVRIGQARDHAPTRLLMLETVRAYATERFVAATEHHAIEERHYRYYFALAQRHGADRALMSAGRQEHLAQLDAEIDNLHAALRWAANRPDADHAIALVAALGSYWLMRDRYSEAIEWIDQALAVPGTDARPALRVRALCVKAWCLQWLGRGIEQPPAMAEAEAIARTLPDPVVLSRALQMRAACEAYFGRRDVAETLADEALDQAMAAEDDWTIATAAFAKAISATTIDELCERVDRAAALLDDVGNVYRLADLFVAAAYGALRVASDHDAKTFVARAIPLVRRLDNPFSWMILQGNRGLAALLSGDTDDARDAFREELTLCHELAARPVAFEALRGLAGVAVVHGDAKRAATLAGAAAAHRYGKPQDPVDARLDAAFLEVARTRYGAETWNAAVREGGALSFEDAIAYALEEPRA